jgi:hypothetical protein
MRFWKRTRAAESVAEFDARMIESRASFIQHYNNATFDFEAGVDDVYARAGVAQPNGSHLPHPDEPKDAQRPESARNLQLWCWNLQFG